MWNVCEWTDHILWLKFGRISPLEEVLLKHCDTQRAQPTLRLHSSRFVVESCDVFVGNRTLFKVFGNIPTVWEPNESFWFRNFVKTGIQFAVCTKTTPWFLWPLNSIWTEHPTALVGSSPSERNRVCVEALLVVWSDLSARAREFDSRLWKSLSVTLIAISFVLVFKAQLSGAKFYVRGGPCCCAVRPVSTDRARLCAGATGPECRGWGCAISASLFGKQSQDRH